MGSLVKTYFAKEESLSPEHIYHVTIMPCLDKRTEAEREEFYDDNSKIRDVDLVLTTADLLELITHHQNDLGTLTPSEIGARFTNFSSLNKTVT